MRLVRTRKRLSKVDNLIAYIFTIARNEAVRLAARRARWRKDHVGPSALFREAAGNDAEAGETAEMVAAALNRLEPAQREIVELKTYAGLTFREIAEVTDLPQGTVATRYRTAIGRLRAWLVRELS